eukprot:532588_1
MAVLIFLLFARLVLNVNTQYACIWGRKSNGNKFINGEWTYYADINNSPWFRKTVTYSNGNYIFHLWRAGNGQFYITDHLNPPDNSTTPNRYYAYCDIATDLPWDCDSNWVVVASDAQGYYDFAVYCQQSLCPEWNCDSIDSTIPGSVSKKCNGTFDVQVGANAWTTDSDVYYFYFHPGYFQWLCVDSYRTQSQETIDYDDGVAAQSGWVQLTGDFADLQLSYPDQNTYRVHCINNPTMPPTFSTSIETKIPTSHSSYSSNTPTPSTSETLTASTTSKTLTASTTSETPIEMYLYFAIGCLVFIALMVIISGIIFNRRYQTDTHFDYKIIASATFHAMDMVSDIFSCLAISNHLKSNKYQICFIMYILTIILPSVTSVVFAFHVIYNKFLKEHNAINGHHLNEWCGKYVYYLFC